MTVPTMLQVQHWYTLLLCSRREPPALAALPATAARRRQELGRACHRWLALLLRMRPGNRRLLAKLESSQASLASVLALLHATATRLLLPLLLPRPLPWMQQLPR